MNINDIELDTAEFIDAVGSAEFVAGDIHTYADAHFAAWDLDATASEIRAALAGIEDAVAEHVSQFTTLDEAINELYFGSNAVGAVVKGVIDARANKLTAAGRDA